MSIKLIDIDKVEAWTGGGMLGIGPHTVKITEADDSRTSSGGHPQVELEFEATDGAGTIRDWLVVIPKTYGKVLMLLNAVGIKPEDGEWEFDPSRLVGKRLTIIVGEEPGNDGKPRKRVQAYEALANPESNGAPADDSGLPF